MQARGGCWNHTGRGNSGRSVGWNKRGEQSGSERGETERSEKKESTRGPGLGHSWPRRPGGRQGASRPALLPVQG